MKSPNLKLAIFSICVWTAVSGTSQAQPSSDRPFEAEAYVVRSKLFAGLIDDLEKQATEAKSKNATLSDGQPKLAAFYSGVASCISDCQRFETEAAWKLKYGRISDWLKKYPNSTSAKVAEASYFVGYAWFARGRGYASTVKEDAWPLFRERIETARTKLEALTGADRNDPGWYASMLQVAVAQGWPTEKFETVYAEGAKRFPTYTDLYFVAALYFTPKWGGSQTAFNEFVEQVVANTKSQLGETMYARVNWAYSSRDMFVTRKADWGRMKVGFQRIMRDYPDPWNANNYAKFACMAGDMKTFSELAKQIGEKPLEAAWFGNVQIYRQCQESAQQAVKNERT